MASFEKEADVSAAVRIASLAALPPLYYMAACGEALTVTVAELDDAPIVHDITSRAFCEFRGLLDPANGSDSETPVDVAEQIRSGGALIGWLGSVPVASVRLTFYPDYLYIGRLGTVPEHRGKGIASALMAGVEETASRLGYSEIRFGTRQKLQKNVDLYVKLNYEISGVRKHSGGSDMVVMFRKHLDVGPNDER